MDFSQFSGINSIFSLVGMLAVYFFTEMIKWRKKRKKSNEKVEEWESQWRSMCCSIKALELLEMMHHTPGEKDIITKLYSDYKTLGGNSYLDNAFKKWLKEN